MTETRGEYRVRVEARKRLLGRMVAGLTERLESLNREAAGVFNALMVLKGGTGADLGNDATWAELLTMAAQEMMEGGDDGQSRPES